MLLVSLHFYIQSCRRWLYAAQQQKKTLFFSCLKKKCVGLSKGSFAWTVSVLPLAERRGAALVCAVVGTADKGDKEAEKGSIVNGVRVLWCQWTLTAPCLQLQGPLADVHARTHAHTRAHVYTLPLSQKREANECVDQQAAQHKLEWVQLRDRGCLFLFFLPGHCSEMAFCETALKKKKILNTDHKPVCHTKLPTKYDANGTCHSAAKLEVNCLFFHSKAVLTSPYVLTYLF